MPGHFYSHFGRSSGLTKITSYVLKRTSQPIITSLGVRDPRLPRHGLAFYKTPLILHDAIIAYKMAILPKDENF